MIDLSKESLPTAVAVHGRQVGIHTGFRFALSAINLLKEGNADSALRLMYTGVMPARATWREAMDALTEFLHPRCELPRDTGEDGGVVMLDYDIDSDFITAAFWQCYNIRLTSPRCDLHWWEFLALLRGIKGTALNDIMDLRAWKADAKDSAEYKRKVRKQQMMWELRKELTMQEKTDIAAFAALVD